MKAAVSSFRTMLVRSAALACGLGLAGCSTLDSIGDLFGSSERDRVPGQRVSLMPRVRMRMSLASVMWRMPISLASSLRAVLRKRRALPQRPKAPITKTAA